MVQGLIQTKEASGGGLPEDGPAIQPTQVLTRHLWMCNMNQWIAQALWDFLRI